MTRKTTNESLLTEREMGILALALVKCDVLSDFGVLPKPWCEGHTDEETLYLLEKIDALGLKIPRTRW